MKFFSQLLGRRTLLELAHNKKKKNLEHFAELLTRPNDCHFKTSISFLEA